MQINIYCTSCEETGLLYITAALRLGAEFLGMYSTSATNLAILSTCNTREVEPQQIHFDGLTS